MLDLVVTMKAFHFMLCHMNPVKLLCILIFFEPGRFHVTGETSIFGNVSFSGDNPGVAPFALHVKLLDLCVAENKVRALDRILRNSMAQLTASRSLSRPLVLEMTQEASRGGYGNMSSLNDLRMTGGAAKLLGAAHLGQMRSMVKEYPFESFLACYQP